MALPDPEVRPKAKRRQFTAEYKKRILDEADTCTTSTQRGALVRREGLYSSHLTSWRRQRAQGILDGLAPKKRGVKPDPLVARKCAAAPRDRTFAGATPPRRNHHRGPKKSFPTPGSADCTHAEERARMIQAVKHLAPIARHYHGVPSAEPSTQQFLSGQQAAVAGGLHPEGAVRVPSPRALTRPERESVRETLNSERFQDQAPREVYCHAAGRRTLSVLVAHHVSDFG